MSLFGFEELIDTAKSTVSEAEKRANEARAHETADRFRTILGYIQQASMDETHAKRVGSEVGDRFDAAVDRMSASMPSGGGGGYSADAEAARLQMDASMVQERSAMDAAAAAERAELESRYAAERARLEAEQAAKKAKLDAEQAAKRAQFGRQVADDAAYDAKRKRDPVTGRPMGMSAKQKREFDKQTKRQLEMLRMYKKYDEIQEAKAKKKDDGMEL